LKPVTLIKYWLGGFMHGGFRPGAGRPKVAPDSVVIRVPAYQKAALGMISAVLAVSPDTDSQLLAIRRILDAFNQDNPL
jgi:hypothetical protein